MIEMFYQAKNKFPYKCLIYESDLPGVDDKNKDSLTLYKRGEIGQGGRRKVSWG